ncbi:MAG: NFACT family protein [Butyricicoccus sp.]
MPLDAICLRAVTNELNNVLAGCRVEKVYQPDRDEIVLQNAAVRAVRADCCCRSRQARRACISLTRLERIRRRRRCSACCCASMCRAQRLRQ